MPLYIKDAIKNIKIFDNNEEIHQIIDFVSGVLLIYGVITSNNLKLLYDKLKPNNFQINILELLNKIHFNNNLMKSEYNHEDKFIYLYLREIDYIYIKEFNPFLININYSFNDYVNMGINYYDKKNLVLDKFSNDLKKEFDYLPFKEIFKALIITSQPFYKESDNYFMQFLPKIYGEKSYLVLANLRKNVPNWKHNGVTLASCPCGSGLEEVNCCKNKKKLLKNKAIFDNFLEIKFFNTFYQGLYMTNLKYQYKSYSNFTNEISEDDNTYLKELMFKDNLIIKALDNHYLSRKDFSAIKIVKGLKNGINGKFLAIKYLDQKLLIFDLNTNNYYLLSGLVSPLSATISFLKLPKVIETRLIPLDDRIVFDTKLSEYEKKINDDLKKIVKKDITSNIIKSLKDLK